MENLEKLWSFLHGYFQAWKSPGKKNPKCVVKVMEMFYIHLFIYAEFKIMNRNDAENISRHKRSYSHIFRAASERT